MGCPGGTNQEMVQDLKKSKHPDHGHQGLGSSGDEGTQDFRDLLLLRCRCQGFQGEKWGRSSKGI